ncbi:MAG: hypothetical protein II794_01410 [Oscillospiraceae bacterium]|nr:hypothetical protein [Oscillospiraceae bacterium]
MISGKKNSVQGEKGEKITLPKNSGDRNEPEEAPAMKNTQREIRIILLLRLSRQATDLLMKWAQQGRRNSGTALIIIQRG